MARQRTERKTDQKRPRARRAGTWAALATAFLTLCVGLVVSPVSPALANPSNGFNPGNIISDANFYQGTAMSAAQVQTFLNQRVPRCTIGDPGKPAGGTYYFPGGGSTKLATKCLKDAVLPSRSMASNPYCSSYVGSKGESAATIIQKVGQACGISQRVLLVMLEKEQSLVQDDFPAQHQFDRAMGYACPDSGPGGSANCDTQYYGFFNQVYYSAWQYKVYRAFPESYRYKPFQNNTIQWHTNLGCGTSNVYIENRATASLYIYTPYRPNQAALNAGWGTGDACSSYGNRNFYNFYNTWFGSPSGPGVAPQLRELYDSLGAEASILGLPTGAASQYGDAGLGQGFSGGSMYWNPAVGASMVRGAVRSEYWSTGSWSGPLGFPKLVEERLPSGGAQQDFQSGTIYWSGQTGAIAVRGAIRAAYTLSGATDGALRFPISREQSILLGAIQEFQGGTMYWKHSVGAHPTRGAIRAALGSAGGVEQLGYPKGPETSLETGGALQEFEFSSIYWVPAAGAHPVRGAIRSAYNANGAEAGNLLYPTSSETRYATGGAAQGFQGGSIYWHPAAGAYPVRAAVRKAFWDAGSISGLGFPLSGEVSLAGGGVKQEFQKGTVFWRHSTGGHAVSGDILQAYLAVQGPAGALGMPTGSARITGTGRLQQEFEGGTILVDHGGKPQVLLATKSSRTEARDQGESIATEQLQKQEQDPSVMTPTDPQVLEIEPAPQANDASQKESSEAEPR